MPCASIHLGHLSVLFLGYLFGTPIKLASGRCGFFWAAETQEGFIHDHLNGIYSLLPSKKGSLQSFDLMNCKLIWHSTCYSPLKRKKKPAGYQYYPEKIHFIPLPDVHNHNPIRSPWRHLSFRRSVPQKKT